jgi:hypothetical protein
MPWTRKQVKYLLSSSSPLTSEQEAKMKAELHADPAMGHAKKGSAKLKKPKAIKEHSRPGSHVAAYDWKQHQGRP